MNSIKAISTRYNGYLMRSRLEARWATFFDALDIKWEYETEGFQFDGYSYLPDFYLPGLGIWCEIKGVLDGSKALELANAFRLNDKAICVVVGTPGDEKIYFYGWDTCENGSGAYEDNDSKWMIATNGKATLNVHPKDHTIYSDSECSIYLPLLNMPESSISYYQIKRAILTARSARFEHGDRQ
jgi:hypothetical protein